MSTSGCFSTNGGIEERTYSGTAGEIMMRPCVGTNEAFGVYAS